MSKIFINSGAGVLDAPEGVSIIADEGIYVRPGLLVRESDGVDFEGWYHIDDNGAKVGGYTRDVYDPRNWTSHPTPDEANWLQPLANKRSVEEEASIIFPDSSIFYDSVVDEIKEKNSLLQVVDDVANNKTYFLTNRAFNLTDRPYKNLLGNNFYIYESLFPRRNALAVADLEGEILNKISGYIISFFLNRYNNFLEDEIASFLRTDESNELKMEVLSSNQVIPEPSFENNIVFYEGNDLYDFKIKNVVRTENSIEINLVLNDTFMGSSSPQMVYSLLDTSAEARYFAVNNITSFKNHFKGTDFYGALTVASKGFNSARSNITIQQVSDREVSLSFYGVADMTNKKILFALASKDNYCVFYVKPFFNENYTYPTIDSTYPVGAPIYLVKKSEYRKDQFKPKSVKISNFSPLYHSYTEKGRAALLFGTNIQEVLAQIIKFPGSYEKKYYKNFVLSTYLHQKTVSRLNRSRASTNIIRNYSKYSTIERLMLQRESIKNLEDGIEYLSAEAEIPFHRNCDYSLNMLIADYSVVLAKRLINKTESMIMLLDKIFSPHTDIEVNIIDLLNDYILKSIQFYDGELPMGSSYLNKALKTNFILNEQTKVIVSECLKNLIKDIKLKIGTDRGRRDTNIVSRAVTTSVSPIHIVHDFKEQTSYSDSLSKKPLPINLTAAGALSIAYDIRSSVREVFSKKTFDAEIVEDIPDLSRRFQKEYSFRYESNLEKYAPNYKLDSCAKDLQGNNASLPKIKIIEYDKKTRENQVQILARHKNMIEFEDKIKRANYILITSPQYVNIADLYNSATQTFKLEAGTYLTKINNGDNYYNKYFLLNIGT